MLATGGGISRAIYHVGGYSLDNLKEIFMAQEDHFVIPCHVYVNINLTFKACKCLKYNKNE